MANSVSWDVEGLDALQKRLSEIQSQAQDRVFAFGARKAAQVIARQAARNAQKLDDASTAESIAKNIWNGASKYPGVRKKSKRSLPPGDIGYRIGVAGGARSYANTKENVRKGRAGKTYETLGDSRNPGGDTFYWRFLEFGTQNMAAQPFLRPAATQAAPEALNVFSVESGKALERAIARSVKKHKAKSKPQRFRR